MDCQLPVIIILFSLRITQHTALQEYSLRERASDKHIRQQLRHGMMQE